MSALHQTPGQILNEVQNLLTALGPCLVGKTQPELVRLGADLWAVSNKLTALTEAIKDKLRESVPPTPGQHTLKGPGAMCFATVPTHKPVLRKGVDAVALKRVLGPDFYRVFEEVPVLREDFAQGLQKVQPQNTPVIMGVLDLSTPKARMSFQLKGS